MVWILMMVGLAGLVVLVLGLASCANNAGCFYWTCARDFGQAGRIGAFTLLGGQLAKNEATTAPNVIRYAGGKVIIEQGGQDTDVYTLLEGGADVFVDAVKVGQNAEEEIFGTIAALMETPRSATGGRLC